MKRYLALLVIFFWVMFQYDNLTAFADYNIVSCPKVCQEQEAKYAEFERMKKIFPYCDDWQWEPYIDCLTK